jgi:hypothetical protein
MKMVAKELRPQARAWGCALHSQTPVGCGQHRILDRVRYLTQRVWKWRRKWENNIKTNFTEIRVWNRCMLLWILTSCCDIL